MAKRRLNDTAAVIAGPSYGAGESHHISTRKIDNGWLVEQSVCNERTGEYRSSCNFTPTQPRLEPGRAVRQGGSVDGGSTLRRTMDYLRDD